MFTKIKSINQTLEQVKNYCTDDFAQISSGNMTIDPSTTTEFDPITSNNLFSSTTKAIGELVPTAITSTLTAIAKNVFVNDAKNVATQCVDIVVNCSTILSKSMNASLFTTLFAVNFTTTVLPEIMKQYNDTEFNNGTTLYREDSDIFSNTTFSSFDENNTVDYNETTSAFPTTNTMSILFDNYYETSTFANDDVFDYADADYADTSKVFVFFFIFHTQYIVIYANACEICTLEMN